MNNAKSKEVEHVEAYGSEATRKYKSDNEEKNCGWEIVTSDDTKCDVEERRDADDVE